MRLWNILRLRLRSLLSRETLDSDLDEELRYHLARQSEEDIASGVHPDEARRRARRALGGVQQRTEECRDARGLNLVENFAQDLRFAARQLLKSPGFTATAVLMIGLGMGASVAILGFVDAALVKPLPYANPERLLNITERNHQLPRANLSYLDYLDWKRQTTTLSSFAVHNGRGYMLRTPSGTELAAGVRVSDGFFRTLGTVPVLGRDFYAGEDLTSAAPAVILSNVTWQKRFGARPDVIGQSVSLSGTPHAIVGVLPPGFQFAPRGDVEFWTTLRASGGWKDAAAATTSLASAGSPMGQRSKARARR